MIKDFLGAVDLLLAELSYMGLGRLAKCYNARQQGIYKRF